VKNIVIKGRKDVFRGRGGGLKTVGNKLSRGAKAIGRGQNSVQNAL
jgi:hypothetical protein